MKQDLTKKQKKKRVLVVDDEEDMIWSLQKNLPNEGLKVIIFTASSGEEALAILEKTKIDLVVTDIRMPGISGIDLLLAIRASYPDIGVIVMTAFPSTESKAEVLEKGGLLFIEKPFDIKKLRESVRKALGEGGAPGENSHFEGKMTGIQLSDLIQVNNLSQASTALRILADGREGVIYFREGAIVHAICDDLAGEEAFYRLMRLKGGTIDMFIPADFPERTITTPVGVLLLKGTLLADEMDNNAEFPNESKQGQPGEPELVAEDAPPAGDDGPELKTTEEFPAILNALEEENMDELKGLLTEFTNIPGVNTACLVGRDGFLLQSVALSGVDAEMVGAIASSGFGASEAMGNQLQKGQMAMTMVEYVNGPVMFSPVGKEAFLVIIADRDANLGMIRLKIKKHSREIEQKAGI